jgi:hypothetical protein
VEDCLTAPPSAWSDPRLFRTFKDGAEKETVISLSKSIPIGSKGIAVLVVNVSVAAIRDYFENVGRSEISFVSVADRGGNELFGQPRRTSRADATVTTSAYTGWTYESGLKAGMPGELYGYLTSGWVLFGFFCLLAGIWWVVYISRKNYKPIETIMSRIRQYNQQQRHPVIREPSGDELSYIDYTLTNMIEATQDYELRSRENERFRRLRLFQELVEGEGTISRSEWSEELRELGIGAFVGISVSLIEIDQYSAFISRYTHQDQGLFKYILSKVVDETAKADSLSIWQEWVTNHRLCVLYFEMDAKPPLQGNRRILAQSEQVREWLHNHLKLTVTFGIGAAVAEMDAVAHSYETAARALSYKSALGGNRVIGYWEIEALSRDDLFVYLQYVRTIAQAFRVGSEGWQEQLRLLFEGLRSLLLPKDDIDGVLIYMNYFFHREMTELPPEYRELWNSEFRLQWDERMETLETLDELEAFYSERLMSCFRKMKTMREE